MFESRRSEIRVIDFRPGDYRTNFNRAMQTDSLTDNTRRAWASLDAILIAAPPPEKAAADLRRALLANRPALPRVLGAQSKRALFRGLTACRKSESLS
jgi:hypothetical protein